MSTNTDQVLVQANFKTPRGTLLNVYGKDEYSFDLGLAILEDRIAKFASIEALLTGASNAAPLVNADVPAPAPGNDVWASPPPSPASLPPSCAHGPRTPKKGNGAKGEWRGWMCPTPKGTPDQCDPKWVKQGTSDWTNFPA